MGAPINNSSFGSPVPPPPPAQAKPTKKNDKRHHCRFCSLSWPTAHSCARHEITHSSDDAKPNKCGNCGKGFSQKTALYTHENTHTGARPHCCRVLGCTSAFGDPSSRTRHEKETHDPSAGFKCADCGDTTKRKEQFKKHTWNMHSNVANDEMCNSARKRCAEAYWAKFEAEGGVRPVKANKPTQPTVKVDEEDRSPPPRPRRNAVASTSQLVMDPPQDYEEEDDCARRISPLSSDHSYFDAANHARTDSIESTDSRPGQYFDGPQDNTFVDTFSPAYTAQYGQAQAGQFYPSEHTLRYPTSQSGTPEQAPISPAQEEASEALLRYMRDPYRFPVMARGYSVSSPQVSMPSPHIPVSSPQVAMPIPRAPLPTEQSLFGQQHWSSPGSSWFPNDIDAMSRVPRAMSASMHPSVQSREHLQEGRHHPYGRHGRRGHAVQEHMGQSFIARTPEQDLPMITSSYHGEPRIASSEPGSPEGMPLSLAGIREHPVAPYAAYEH